jgi:hypothetical protein
VLKIFQWVVHLRPDKIDIQDIDDEEGKIRLRPEEIPRLGLRWQSKTAKYRYS